MNVFFAQIKFIFTDTSLRKKILFVFFALLIFRLGANIPIPGVDTVRLQEYFANNSFLGLLNVFSGGGLSNLSLFMLGVGPYITASIIMQLLTMIFPKIKEMMHEEGSLGRKKFTRYSRFLTVPLAVVQGFALLSLLRTNGVLADLTIIGELYNITLVVAGSVLLMWMGEL